jgi:hypothetical protein
VEQLRRSVGDEAVWQADPQHARRGRAPRGTRRAGSRRAASPGSSAR